MALASTNVLMIEQTPQNGSCQCLCPQGESQLPPSSPGGSPWPTNGFSQAAFKLLPLCWHSGQMIFHVHPLSTESMFPVLHQLSCTQVPLRRTGGLSSQCRTPKLGSSMWCSDLSLFGKNLCNCDYPPVCGSSTWGYGFWLYIISIPPTHLVVPSFFSF